VLYHSLGLEEAGFNTMLPLTQRFLVRFFHFGFTLLRHYGVQKPASRSLAKTKNRYNKTAALKAT